MNIIVTDISGALIFVIPYAPLNAKIEGGSNYREIDTLDKVVCIPAHHTLRTISWSSFFPLKNNSFSTLDDFADGHEFIAFIRSSIQTCLPVRVITTTSDGIPIFNMLAMVDKSFKYSFDKREDIEYSIKLIEVPQNIIQYITAAKKVKNALMNNLNTEALNETTNKLLKKFGLI